MDVVSAVIFGNCAIAIVLLVTTISTMRLRRQVVALTSFLDRWIDDCQVLSIETPRLIAATRTQIFQLRQIYSQQLLTIDRIRLLRSVFGVGRSLVKRGIRRV